MEDARLLGWNFVHLPPIIGTYLSGPDYTVSGQAGSFQPPSFPCEVPMLESSGVLYPRLSRPYGDR